MITSRWALRDLSVDHGQSCSPQGHRRGEGGFLRIPLSRPSGGRVLSAMGHYSVEQHA